MKNIFACILLFLTFAGNIEAQKKWTLEECIDHALKQNISLQSSKLNAENEAIRYQQAKNQRLPGLSAYSSQSMSFGQSMNNYGVYENKNSQSYSAGLSASVTVFNGFQVTNQIKAQEFNMLATLEDLNKAKESMSVSIASAYLQVLYNKELYQLAKEQVELSKTQVSKYEFMAEQGKIPEGQVYEVKAQHAKDKQSEAESLSNLQLSLLDLSQMLELKDWSDFDIVVPQIDIDALGLQISNADEVYNYAETNKSSVKASEYRLKGSEKSLKIAEGNYYPSLSFGASYSNGYYPDYEGSFSDQIDINSRTAFGFNLSIPIFNKFDTRNSVRIAKNNLKTAQLDVENTKKTLYKEIQQAWFNAKTALEKYYASSETLKQSEIAYKFAEEKFNYGRSTVYEYNDARMNRTTAISNQLQAKYNYLFCVKILDFYKGLPLNL
jgi:outer membrane protein